MSEWMVFDVESVGLHGEGYAVGWVIVGAEGTCIASACYACDPAAAVGSEEDRAWLRKNVPVPHMGYTCQTPRQVREAFWRAWEFARVRGVRLAADCSWPVEARFLAACIDDEAHERSWNGPYPLFDVAVIRFAAGLDPNAVSDRLADELPVHDPMSDAKQSARLLVEALKILQQHAVFAGDAVP